MKNIFLLMENADKSEGRGPYVPKAAFLNEKDAIEAKNTQQYDYLCTIEKIVLYDDFKEYDFIRKSSIKESALAKLTYEEKKALNLL